MNISLVAFKYKPVVFLMVSLLMAYGIYSYFTLPAREDPALLIREAVVVTHNQQLSSKDIERLVTKPIEEALLQISELSEIKSTSMNGTSIIHATIADNFTELEGIWDQLEEQVLAMSASLPPGTLTPQINDEFGDVAVITLALSGSDYSLDEKFDYAQHLRDNLIGVQGTKKVDIVGMQPEQIFIEYQNKSLLQTGLSPMQIANALNTHNIPSTGGQFDSGQTIFLIDTNSQFTNLDEIKNIQIPSQNGARFWRLGDIATITKGYADPPVQKAYFNGKESLVIAIAMFESESVINYSKRAKAKIDELALGLPVGLDLEYITFQSDQVENTVYGVSINMLQTLVIVMVVVILFLGLRIGLIVGSIIPAVVLTTLGIMGVFGLPLERMSLATLIISLGLLVDNGIVVAENFKRCLEEGQEKIDALKNTSKDLALPLLTSSITTISVFLPLMIAQTSSSEYTRSISIVMLIALSISWIFAMTITTTLCHKYIPFAQSNVNKVNKTNQTKVDYFLKIEDLYGAVLEKVLTYRWLYIAFLFVLFAGAIGLLGTVQKKFFPDSDRAQLLVYVDAPVNVSSTITDEKISALMQITNNKENYPEIEDVVAYVGFGGPRFVLSLTPLDPAPHKGFMLINVENLEAAKAVLPRLRSDFRQMVPSVNARISRMFLGPEDPNTIQIQLRGPDAQYIYSRADELKDILYGVPNMIDVWSDWYSKADTFSLDIDYAQAKKIGVSTQDIAMSLARHNNGMHLTDFRDGDEVIPVILRATEAERKSFDALLTTPIYSTSTTATVPLSALASIDRAPSFPFIQKEDLINTLTIEGRNLSLTPEDMAPMLKDTLNEFSQTLEAGHFVEFDGILDDTAATNKALAATLPIVFSIILILLVAQFNGFKGPAILLIALPLVVIGASIGLWLFNGQFGFMVILGLYALMGIIVNNSIVLVDRIDAEINSKDHSPFDAVITASKRRLRPILMATITTIVGLLPLIISRDVLFYDMAIAMAFGLGIGTLLISTMLTPVLYSLFYGISTATAEQQRTHQGAKA